MAATATAAMEGFDLVQVLEALRATRELAVNFSGVSRELASYFSTKC